MLAEAAQLINEAHFYGLVTVLWIYPRGKAVGDEKDPHLIAGAAGVAACLGSDFVKVNAPKKDGKTSPELLREAVLAAGRTKLVCAGGSATTEEKFIRELYEQINTGGAQETRPAETSIRNHWTMRSNSAMRYMRSQLKGKVLKRHSNFSNNFF